MPKCTIADPFPIFSQVTKLKIKAGCGRELRFMALGSPKYFCQQPILFDQYISLLSETSPKIEERYAYPPSVIDQLVNKLRSTSVNLTVVHLRGFLELLG